MSEWKKPELVELSIGKTENTYKIGKNQDGGTWEFLWMELPLFSDSLCNKK